MVGAPFREAVVGDDLARVIEHLYHHPGQSREEIARALGMAGAKLEVEIKRGCRLYGARNLDQLFFRIVSESDECPDHPALKDAENQVLKCLAEGLSRQETAARLGVGLSTAKRLGRMIRLILKCRGNMEAVMLALGQAGLLREFGDLFARFTGRPAAPAKKRKRG
jgi:DNA-binding CsgD family transcriptional regulator